MWVLRIYHLKTTVIGNTKKKKKKFEVYYSNSSFHRTEFIIFSMLNIRQKELLCFFFKQLLSRYYRDGFLSVQSLIDLPYCHSGKSFRFISDAVTYEIRSEIYHLSLLLVIGPRRAAGVLLRNDWLLEGGGGEDPRAPPPPQGAAAVVLRQGPPHPRRHLGARLLAALPGPHQAVRAHLQPAGCQR